MKTIYQKSINATEMKTLSAFQKGSWVSLEDPTEEELAEVATLFEVGKDTLTDALDPYETPRIEFDNESVCVFLRSPEEGASIPFLIVIGEGGILTVTRKKNAIIERFQKGEVEFFTTQKTRFLFLIFSETNSAFFRAITKIRRAVNRKRTNPDKMTERDVIDFVSYESAVNDYLDALIPQQVVLNRILSGRALSIHDDDRDLVEDLILSTNQLIETSRSAIKTMINIRGAYTAISTERLNRILRTLTAITVILTIPLGITGFYGMNVALPGSEHPFSAIFIGVLILSLSGGLLALFIKQRWL